MSAAQDVINDYKTNGKRSVTDVERRILLHLLPYFGGRRLSEITAATVRAFVAHRQAQPITGRRERKIEQGGQTRIIPAVTKQVSNAEINRELQILKRCFSLTAQAGKVLQKPHIALLQESAPRSGFFERAQFEAVRRHLPEDLQGLVTFAYVTGWRCRAK